MVAQAKAKSRKQKAEIEKGVKREVVNRFLGAKVATVCSHLATVLQRAEGSAEFVKKAVLLCGVRKASTDFVGKNGSSRHLLASTEISWHLGSAFRDFCSKTDGIVARAKSEMADGKWQMANGRGEKQKAESRKQKAERNGNE